MKRMLVLISLLEVATSACNAARSETSNGTDTSSDMDTDSDGDSDTDTNTDTGTDTDTLLDTDSVIPQTCEQAETATTTVGCLFYGRSGSSRSRAIHS